MRNLILLSFVALLAVSSTLTAQEYDDIYYNPSDEISAVSDVTYDDDYLGNSSSSTANADDDYYVDNDYQYSSRIRRFHRSGNTGYYSDYYVNSYYYNPYAPVTSIYVTPAYTYSSFRRYNSWNNWYNPYANPFNPYNSWNTPYNTWGRNNGWNSWNSWNGWNNGYGSPAGYNAYNPACVPFAGGSFRPNSNIGGGGTPLLDAYGSGGNSNTNRPVVNSPRRGTNSSNGSNVNTTPPTRTSPNRSGSTNTSGTTTSRRSSGSARPARSTSPSRVTTPSRSSSPSTTSPSRSSSSRLLIGW